MDAELALRMTLTAMFVILAGRSIAMSKQTADRRPLKFEFPSAISVAVISGIAIFFAAREGDVWGAAAMGAVLAPLHAWTILWAWRRRRSVGR